HRFIPAGAGNTHHYLDYLIRQPVYPRWRGEHAIGVLDKLEERGLSPLARGTPPAAQQQRGNQRFIPAGAGNTLIQSPFPSAVAVYPRWRGEHVNCDVLRQ
ncbi:hypothetical protein A15G_03945, partial [Escherichia coli KTE203]